MYQAELIEMKPEETVQSYEDYFKYLSSKRTSYINDCNKFYDATFGNIYSQTELTDMNARGQYPVKLNRPLKYLTMITGMMTADKPSFRAYPQGIADNAVSAVCNKILHHIHKRSKGGMVLHRAVFHSLASNMGYVSVGQNDRNFTTMRFTAVEDVVVSTDAYDPFFTDASVIYRDKWLPKKVVSDLYNIPMDEISDTAPPELAQFFSGINGQRSIVESHMYDPNQSLIKVIEGEHRVVMKEMMEEPANEEGLPPKKVWTGNTKVKIIKKTLIGYKHAFIQEMPDSITEHSDIPIYSYDTKNTFKLGLMSRLYEYNRLANKFFSVMILNAQLASNPKVFVYEGQIPENDIDAFSDTYAQPGSINLLAGTGGEGSIPPVIVAGQPISSAWFQLVQSVTAEMEFSSVPNQTMGMDMSQTNRVSKAFEQYQMTIESIRTFLNIFEFALAQVGKVALQYFVTYNADQLPKLLDQKGIEAEIAKSQAKGLQYDDNSQLLAKTAEESGNTIRLEDEIIKYKQNVDYLEAIKYITSGADFTDFDIEVVKESYLPSHSILKFFQKLELYREGIVDNETLLEDSDLENKSEIINRVSTNRRLMSENERVLLDNQKLTATVEELGNKLMSSEQTLVVKQGQFKQEKQYTQARAKDSATAKIEKMRNSMQRMAIDYNNKSQVDDYLGKIEKAIMEYELAKKNVADGGDGFPRKIDIGSVIAKINERNRE